MSEHKVTLTADEHGVHWQFVCTFDKADPMRPCWPSDDETGLVPMRADEPYAAMCNYQEWFENDEEGIRMPTLTFPVRAEWTDAGYFTFHLAAPTVEEPG